MKAKYTNKEEMEKALAVVSKQYEDNVIFNRFDVVGKQIHFTLRVKDSKKAGHRLHVNSFGGKNRRSCSACWHVHGDFFDALLEINPEAVIISGGNLKIDKNGGNWQDRNIGSIMYPFYFSESCECE